MGLNYKFHKCGELSCFKFFWDLLRLLHSSSISPKIVFSMMTFLNMTRYEKSFPGAFGLARHTHETCVLDHLTVPRTKGLLQSEHAFSPCIELENTLQCVDKADFLHHQ